MALKDSRRLVSSSLTARSSRTFSCSSVSSPPLPRIAPIRCALRHRLRSRHPVVGSKGMTPSPLIFSGVAFRSSFVFATFGRDMDLLAQLTDASVDIEARPCLLVRGPPTNVIKWNSAVGSRGAAPVQPGMLHCSRRPRRAVRPSHRDPFRSTVSRSAGCRTCSIWPCPFG